MLKTYQSKTPCKGDIHSSKSLKLRISFCLDSWHNIGERRYVYKESGIQIQWHELFQQPPPPVGSGVVRIDPLRFLAGYRTRRLNQVSWKACPSSWTRETRTLRSDVFEIQTYYSYIARVHAFCFSASELLCRFFQTGTLPARDQPPYHASSSPRPTSRWNSSASLTRWKSPSAVTRTYTGRWLRSSDSSETAWRRW